MINRWNTTNNYSFDLIFESDFNVLKHSISFESSLNAFALKWNHDFSLLLFCFLFFTHFSLTKMRQLKHWHCSNKKHDSNWSCNDHWSQQLINVWKCICRSFAFFSSVFFTFHSSFGRSISNQGICKSIYYTFAEANLQCILSIWINVLYLVCVCFATNAELSGAMNFNVPQTQPHL